jgi:uncharacterized glyoxalase superfamily protein PhnB
MQSQTKVFATSTTNTRDHINKEEIHVGQGQIQVEDVDEVFSRAGAEGGKVLRPVKDEFYGDRSGKLKDPFGHIWYVSTRKEDLSAAEVEQR